MINEIEFKINACKGSSKNSKCNQQLDSILICDCSVTEGIKVSKEQEKSE